MTLKIPSDTNIGFLLILALMQMTEFQTVAAAVGCGCNPNATVNSAGQDQEIFSSKLWPRGIVPFALDKSFTQTQASLIISSLIQIEKAAKSSISFKHLSQNLSKSDVIGDYVFVTDGSGCSSVVGRQGGGRQDLILNSSQCMRADIVQRQFMHALGFYSEHQRPDRAKHISILWRNIRSDQCSKFRIRGQKVPPGYPRYDRRSILHFRSNAYKCGSKSTILTLRGNLVTPASSLTKLDAERLQYVYGQKLTPDGGAVIRTGKSSSSDSDDSSSNTPMIIGFSVGGPSGCIFFIICCYCCCKYW